jgi:hypothetical protein
MGCDFPEHHGSSGGGPPWALIIAVCAVALLAPLVGVIIHVIALVLTFVGIASIAAGGGWAWWRITHRQPRQLVYQPQTQMAPGWGQPGLPQDQQQAIGQGGQHLHLHLGGLSPAERAEVVRQLRGH